MSLGCNAIVYEDGNTHGLWVSWGVDTFYLGPSKDHCRCDNYYVPKTRAYHIYGSTELFPQHCQLPSLTPHQHFRALTNKLTKHMAQANNTTKGTVVYLDSLHCVSRIFLIPPPMSEEQRVEVGHPAQESEAD